MPNPNKRKGDEKELEAAKLLTDQLGYDVVRKLGAGRREDTGDLYGIPDTVIQVKAWKDVGRAVNEARDGADEQARNAGVPFRAGMVRHPGGKWTVCMSVDAFCTLLREALT